MAKKSKRKNYTAKKLFSEEISNSPIINPNATLSPDSNFQNSTTGQWLSKDKDSTNAPQIGEEEKQESYARSNAELIDKYILSKQLISIPLLIVFAVIGYMFIQDNGAGNLKSWQGIWWTIQKSGVVIAISIIIMVIDYIRKYLNKKFS